LESARYLFASVGYEQTSIRAVAERACVDSALVMHYFSSKEGLLRAAMDWPFDMDEAAHQIFEGDPQRMGERLVRMVCEVWENETTRHPLAVILRNAVQREDAARLVAQWVGQAIVGRLVARTQDPAAALRGVLAHSALVGLVTIRYIIGIEPLASAPVNVVVQAVGPTIQRYLTGDIDGSDGRPDGIRLPA
jgi:AcrR family transcriptional regulator